MVSSMTVSRKVERVRNYWEQHQDHVIGECEECDQRRFANQIADRQRAEREAQDPKVRENRLRRAASRQGLLLVKSRRRDPKAHDYGLYLLVDDTVGSHVPAAQMRISAFANGGGMTLDQVEERLHQ
jgi:hypothetical protein